MIHRWTIRQLLFGVNLFILLVPLGALVFLQIFDAYLLRQTERQLIAESVVIGEAWRGELLEELGAPPGAAPEIRPAAQAGERYAPYRPLLNLGYKVSPSAAPSVRQVAPADEPAQRAAAAVEPLLERSKVFNLSAVRILDAGGCVVGTSGGERGDCLEHLEEVRAALTGRYSAVVRPRISDEPPPPLNSIRRRSKLRVYTAMPVLMDGAVAGVVRMSRTAASPLELLWAHRGKVALMLGIVFLLTPVSSYLFSHAISKPVRALTREAEKTTRGAGRGRFVAGPLAPREVLILGEALDRMTTQLTEQSDYVLGFASDASHELKSPLTGITGAVELLQDEWEQMADDQRRRFLVNIAEDAARMERLVGDLLQLARLESGPEKPVRRVELEPFLRELARRHDGRVRLDLAGAPESIRIDPDLLETALRNLVENALRHGGDQPVDVAVSRDRERVAFTVRDRGPGIAEGDRERVFDRFFTTRREAGGTGLGLAIVRAVARARGGSVDFETGPEGTIFRLVL